MFINSQMYVLTTTLLVTIRACNAEPQSVIALLANVDAMGYQLHVNTDDHRWPQKTEMPQPERGTDTVFSPTIFYPLFMRLSAAYETQTVGKRRQKPQPPAQSEPEKSQPLQDGGTAADADRVPLHAPGNSMMSGTDANDQSTAAETHGSQINGNNSYSGQINNSVAIEYLPTIAVPFLDSITHGIISEIHQHVQLIKPGRQLIISHSVYRYPVHCYYY